MALLKRQSFTYEIFDDQSPVLMKTYQGNWTHYNVQGFNNNTITATPNPGASFSLTFSGTRAYLYGGLLNSSDAEGDDFTIGWPTASYSTDGVPGGSQKPYYDTDNSSVIYFATPSLANGSHKIDVTVTAANDTSLYIIDYFLVVPSGGDDSGVQTTRAAPSSTSSTSSPVTTHSTPVGAIVGGIVGGIGGIALLLVAAYYFMYRRSRGGRAYYFEKPDVADVLADRVEPFNATPGSPPVSSAGFNGRGPQSAYSDGSSNQPLNPTIGQTVSNSQYTQSGPSEPGVTHVSGISAQPRSGKAALMAQQYDNVQQPVQLEDSGVRFNENGEQEGGPSQLPTEVPPTYTPN